MPDITLADKLSCVRRELRLRRELYPGFVQRERMTQAQADFQLACMEAIVFDYEERTVVDSGQAQLFGKETPR